ncbi:hypothetical protein HK098_002780 [Nowakowskiella sp. JEL0407]|nr:hypothetical protein HK098_002780 [Nowakowskiella sp. JEL0407]
MIPAPMNSTKKSAKKNSRSANNHVNTSKLASEASSKSVLPDNSVSKIDTPTSNASQSTPVAEQDHCIICTEPISIYAFGSCNHRQCHLCALRLRALYKSKSCSYCKTDQASLIFTTDATTPYESFDLQSMQENSDKKLSIFCENKDVYAELLMLLRFNCPHEDCEVSCPGGWGELKKHVKDVHKLVMCDLCTRHKKVFTHEHALFAHQQLQKHIKDGDPYDPSFKGHPNCGFCRTNFYDSDELYDHCKQKHEQCFLCVRNGIRHQYYVDYNSLEEHFKDDHYYCRRPQCVEKKFVVFATDIDFKAHELEEHSESSGGKKKSVQVDANFIYNSPSRSGSSGTRGNRNNNNNNADSNSQPILVVSERRHPRREFPRLGENTSSSSDSLTTNEVTTPARKNKAPPPGFGSELTESNSNTSTNTTTVSIAQQLQQSQSTNSPRLRPPPGFGSQLTKEDFPLPSATTSTPTTQVTETVIPNEPELQTRIRKLFQMDASNFTEFKTHTAGYRRGDLTAAALFSKFRDYALVNRVGKVDKSETEVEMGKVWIKMAESFPPDDGGGEDKRAEMLRVLNDWKARKTHENSFPVPKPNTNWTTNSSSSSTPAKVLVIKPGSNAPAPRRNPKTYTSSSVSANRRPPLSTAPLNKTLRTMTLVDSAPSLNNSGAGNGSVWTDEDFPPPPSVKVPARDQFEDAEEDEGEKSSGSGKKKGKKGKQVLMHFG